jgi:hypothetical protein
LSRFEDGNSLEVSLRGVGGTGGCYAYWRLEEGWWEGVYLNDRQLAIHVGGIFVRLAKSLGYIGKYGETTLRSIRRSVAVWIVGQTF